MQRPDFTPLVVKVTFLPTISRVNSLFENMSISMAINEAKVPYNDRVWSVRKSYAKYVCRLNTGDSRYTRFRYLRFRISAANFKAYLLPASNLLQTYQGM
jgi:hypothetical protein